MTTTSEDNLFEQSLKFVGKEVEISLASSGETLRGKVIYSMFDSLLLCTKEGNRVISFYDLVYLNPLIK